VRLDVGLVADGVLVELGLVGIVLGHSAPPRRFPDRTLRVPRIFLRAAPAVYEAASTAIPGSGIAEARGRADEPHTAAMELGDLVIWSGRRWIVRGVDPVSVTGRTVTLEDPESGECVTAPLDAVLAESAPGT
jgi:hypothetical protein